MSSASSELLKINTIVRAGAGAGKTTRLVEEVIDFATSFKKQNGTWPRMVLTTFTRKATQELKERLILKACEVGDQELLEYLSSNSYLQISTIHGVMSLFLRRYGHLVGLDNGYSVVTDEEAERLAKIIVRDMSLENSLLMDLMSLFGLKRLSQLLRKMSTLKLEHPEAHPVTHQELKYYWAEYLKQICGEFHQILQEVRGSTNDSKFLQFCDEVERALADIYPVQDDTSRQMTLILERLPRQKPRINKKDPQVTEDLHNRIGDTLSRFKKELQRPELQSSEWEAAIEVYQKLNQVFPLFHERYFSEKSQKGQFEMSDLESVTVDILRRHEGLGNAFSSDFDFWLIDEYQDTSPIQVELLNRLIGEQPVFVVGDPQQSIYLFRGARSEVFGNMQSHISNTGGRVEIKKQNWRSEPELLLFFNDFFKNYSSTFIEMDPREPVTDPEKTVAYFCPISAEELEDDEEVQWHAMAKRIHALLNNNTEPEDICILGRTNRELFMMAQYLRFHGFPTHLHVSSGFYQRREVLDAMALLRFLVSPHDNRNLILLLRSPWCRVDDALIAEILQERPKGSYWNLIEKNEALDEHEVIRELKALRQMRLEFGVSYCFEKALIDFGCIDFSHHHDVSGRRESNFWKLLSRLKDEEKKPGFSYLKFINRSFAELDTEDGNEESDAVASLEPNHIQLMTIHSSKGLQFSHIFLTDMHKIPSTPRTPMLSFDESCGAWSATLPIGEGGENQATIADLWLKNERKKLEDQEFERVLYVALTRAKESVFLSWIQPEKEGSWISRIPWSLSPGTHRRENFSYQVLSGPWQAVDYSESSQRNSEIRQSFQFSSQPQRPEKRSVTSLVEEAAEGISVAKSSVTPKKLVPERIKKAVEGVLVHRMMEVLKFDWNFHFEDVAPVWFAQDSDRFLKAVNWVRETSEVPLKDIVANGFVEWGYQMMKGRQIIEGQIDLWGMVEDKLWIVDYKTGSQKYQQEAFRQLEIYAEALSAYQQASKICLCVIYPMEQLCKVRILSPTHLSENKVRG